MNYSSHHLQNHSSLILSQLNTAVLCFAQDNRLTHLNPCGESLLDQSITQARGKTATNLLGALIGQTMQQVRQTDQSTTIHDTELINHLGKPHSVDITITPLANEPRTDEQNQPCLLAEIVQIDNR